MKKNLVFVFLLILTLFLSSCNQQKKDKEYVQRLVVGTNATYPPYEFINEEGKTIGFDIDLAHALAEKLGKEVDVREFSFDALILNLQKKKIDCILAGMSITPEREERIAMIPYYGSQVTELGLVFWKKAPSCPCNFSQYKFIAAQTGTLQEKFACFLAPSKVKPVESILDLIMEVKYCKSDVAIIGSDLISILKNQFPEIIIIMLPLPDSWKILGNGIGINKENKELIEKVRVAIQELKDGGVIDSLEKKWFNS